MKVLSSPAEQQNLAAKYGLDRPLWEQFGLFLLHAVQGDFGKSYVYKTRTVQEILWEAFPVSLGLGAMALVLATLLGVGLGILAAMHQNSLWDYLSVTTAMIAVSIPNFVMAVFLILLFSFLILIMSMLGAGLLNIFIAIGLTGWLNIARLTRAQILSLMEKEFVEGARAAGAGGVRVLSKHLLPNALTPIIVAVTFGIPEAIFTEAALSFIGVGINPPTPSWGQMVGEYQVSSL